MSLYDAVKDALKVAQSIDNVELQGKLFDLQNQALELQEENTRLRREIEQLHDRIRIEGDLEVGEGPVYWLSRRGRSERDGPFCTRCWDVDHALVRLRSRMAGPDRPRWFCPGCKSAVRARTTN